MERFSNKKGPYFVTTPAIRKLAQTWHSTTIYFETIVAAALGFELWVTLPHDILCEFNKSLSLSNRVLSLAYEFCNECMNGEIIAQVPVETIGAASVYFAHLLDGIPSSQQPQLQGKLWWEHYAFTQSSMIHVANEALKPRRSMESFGKANLVSHVNYNSSTKS